jgi:hypothetical protein
MIQDEEYTYCVDFRPYNMNVCHDVYGLDTDDYDVLESNYTVTCTEEEHFQASLVSDNTDMYTPEDGRKLLEMYHRYLPISTELVTRTFDEKPI